MHPLLTRQLRRLDLDPAVAPTAGVWAAFVEAVDRGYSKADEDRYTLERSLDVSSAEMRQICVDLREASASELAIERDRMQALFASLGEGLFVLTGEGRIADVNPEALRLLGGGAADAIGRAWHEVIAVDASIAGSVGPLRDADGVVRRADGGALSVRLSLNPVAHLGSSLGAVLVFRDVTGRKLQEDLLRESNDRYRSLVRNASHGICEVRANGQLLAVNPALVTMLGYDSEEEMLALDVDTLQRRGLKPSEIARASGEGERVENLELEWTRKDGRAIIVRVVGRGVPGAPGGVPSFELVVEDVTERLAFERRLRQSQKMEAIGRLAGGIAHDFNNLLTAILGYANLALERTRTGDPLRHEIAEIVTSGERAATLTRQLLAFSRRQVMRAVVVDVNGIVAGMEAMLGRLIGENVCLDTRLSADTRPVMADAGPLEQVIMNLVVNARDAMPEGGQLTIETSLVTLDAEYGRAHGAAIAPGEYTMIAVSDTGCGMDAETQARIFEPFFTTKGTGRGTGLGLSTVYGIVKQSGGYVWLYSEPQRGTTFKVYLPAANRMAAPAPGPRAVAPPPRRGTETLLVVEDEPAVRELTCEALRRHGYTVIEAADGVDAVQAAPERLSEIAMVVTDVVMPRMSGPQLAQALGERAPAMKILYVSGYTDTGIVKQGLLEPGVRFLQKPFSPVALARTVRELLDQSPEPLAA